MFVLIASINVAANAGNDPGYLACVGPVPLRFRAVPAPITNVFVLPPPLPEPVALPKPDTNAPVMVPSASLPAEPAAIINEVSSAPPEPPHQDEVVSPQMFLKYFNKGTNGNSTTVIAPLDFTPPKVAEPAASGSKATYSTGP